MQPRLLPPLLVIALLLVAGCGCPPLVTDYSSPRSTLDTWQAHLCHDDVDGEYRCFSTGFKRGTGNFETYFAARNALLEREPLLAAALARVALGDHLVATHRDDDLGRAELVLAFGERRTTVGFVRETVVILEFADGSRFVAHAAPPLGLLVQRHARLQRQYIELSEFSPLPVDRLADTQSVLLEQRWKIDAIEGLMPDPGVAP